MSEGERDRGNPVILALGHLGNWDLSGQTIASQGIPGIFLMRNQRNPLINDWINRARTSEGSEVIERSDPQLLRKVTRSLKEGKVLAILIDIRAQQDAYALPFLGGTANVGRGLSVFARMTGATIFPAHLERVGYRTHRWAITDPIR